LPGQGRDHVGRGVPCRLCGLAKGRSAARPGDHVRLLAPGDGGRGMNDAPTILVLGATSAIAQAYARRRAGAGAAFVLAGRREDRLAAIAGDLTARGASSAELLVADLAGIEGIEARARGLPARFGERGELVRC